MKILRLVFFFSTLLLVAACGAEPSLRLNANGSGKFDLHLRLAKPFADYLLDLGEIAGMYASRDQAVLFDLGIIEKKLTWYPGVKVTALKATPDGTLSLALSFADVSVFARPGELWPDGSPFSFTQDARKTLRLRLDKAVMYRVITSFFNFKSSELEVFLPRENESRREYEDNLDFALDGGAALFRNSTITFQVTVPGAIQSHNGKLQGTNTVQFSVPLGTLLFLDKPVEYYVTYN